MVDKLHEDSWESPDNDFEYHKKKEGVCSKKTPVTVCGFYYELLLQQVFNFQF